MQRLITLTLSAALALVPGCVESPGAPDPLAPDASAVDDPTRPDAGMQPLGAQRIVAYFAAWGVYGRDYHVADIPADRLTHINYAFANISADGACVLGDPYADIDKFYEGDSWDAGALRGSFNQLLKLKQAHPHVKTLISVGGWSWSGRFSDAALTATSRASFAASCVAMMKQYGFDGIDIDWEYPVSGGLPANTTRPEDEGNFTLMMRELRDQLDALEAADGRDYLLTIAAPAGPGIYANLEIAQLGEILDWINVMTYDFNGGWAAVTNFNAPLYASAADPTTDPIVRTTFNADAAMQAYVDAGVPPGKLVMGVPFYGRGWSGVSGGDGLFRPAAGPASPGTWEAGVFDYHDLVANYLPMPSYQRHRHPEAKVPWLFSSEAGVMISYDDPESMATKAEYVLANGMGGVMFWELSGDTSDSALLGALHTTLAQ